VATVYSSLAFKV